MASSHYFCSVRTNFTLTFTNSFLDFIRFTCFVSYLSLMNSSAITAQAWLVLLLQHFLLIIISVIDTRQVVFVQLEATWMGANKRTVQKQANNQKTVCRFWEQRSMNQGHRNSLPLSRTKTNSLHRWLALAVMSRITNRLNNRWLKVKRLPVVSYKGCGKRKQWSSSTLLWRKKHTHAHKWARAGCCVFSGTFFHIMTPYN